MMPENAVALGALALLLCSSSVAQAKAWTQPEGEGYAKLALRGVVGDKAYTATGAIEESAAYADVSVRHYLEFGVADKWTLLTHGSPAGWAQYDGASTPYAGPLFMGVRRGFLDGPLQLAAEVHYGYSAGLGEQSLGATDAKFGYAPAVQTHAAGGELQVGYGFDWGWAVASTGMRWHSRDALDAAVIGFGQVGANATDTFQVDLHMALYEPIGEVVATNVSGVGQTRYLGLGLGASWWPWQALGFSIEADGAVYAESNAAAPAFGLGVQWRMR